MPEVLLLDMGIWSLGGFLDSDLSSNLNEVLSDVNFEVSSFP